MLANLSNPIHSVGEGEFIDAKEAGEVRHQELAVQRFEDPPIFKPSLGDALLGGVSAELVVVG